MGGHQVSNTNKPYKTTSSHSYPTALDTRNVAFGKPTWQISQYSDAVPSRAVDGNKAPYWDSRSCTHTNHHQNAWWAVDLQASLPIHTVVVRNRVDGCKYVTVILKNVAIFHTVKCEK